MDIYRINYPDGKDLTYLKDEETIRKRKNKGSHLDKFLLTDFLCFRGIEFKHTRNHFYTAEYGMQDNSFDNGSVRMTFNKTQLPTGPGQFKLDPFLITKGLLML